jgi:hypothetical protein
LSVGNQTRNNRILLENYYVPGDLEAQIDAFVADYNHRRYGRRLLWTRKDNPVATRRDQTPDYERHQPNEPEPSVICTGRWSQKL